MELIIAGEKNLIGHENSLSVQVKSQQYIAAATSENTRKTYRSAIRQYQKWGGLLPANQHDIVRYLVEKAGQTNPRTLSLHLTAIGQWHVYQGFNDPVKDPMVSKTMEGIRNTHGTPKKKAKALRLEHLLTILNGIDPSLGALKAFRDTALLLCAFFGALRRSEVVAITIKDLVWEPEGLIIHLPRSKTDQSGEGMVRAIPFGPKGICPATALRTWIGAAGIVDGPVFRGISRWGHVRSTGMNAGSVNEILKGLAEQCGLDFAEELSGHSFRRGFSTTAAREKVDFELIKKQGGWRSDATVWEYIEDGQRLTHNGATPLMEKLAKLKGHDGIRLQGA